VGGVEEGVCANSGGGRGVQQNCSDAQRQRVRTWAAPSGGEAAAAGTSVWLRGPRRRAFPRIDAACAAAARPRGASAAAPGSSLLVPEQHAALLMVRHEHHVFVVVELAAGARKGECKLVQVISRCGLWFD